MPGSAQDLGRRGSEGWGAGVALVSAPQMTGTTASRLPLQASSAQWWFVLLISPLLVWCFHFAPCGVDSSHHRTTDPVATLLGCHLPVASYLLGLRQLGFYFHFSGARLRLLGRSRTVWAWASCQGRSRGLDSFLLVCASPRGLRLRASLRLYPVACFPVPFRRAGDPGSSRPGG